MRFAAVCLAATLALAGCAAPPPERLTLPDITFEQSPTLIFAASRVESLTDFQPSFAAPHIEHMLAQPPARVAERWARDRLRHDASQPNTVQVHIRDASVIEQDIAKTPGLRGNFTTDQVARFEVSIAITIELRNERGFRLGEVTGTAKRSNTLSEKATLNDRERLIHDLIRQTMIDVDAQLEKNARAYMPLYVQ